jgi:plasmid stabilization system protein ParE
VTKIIFTQEATDNLINQALYIYKQSLDIDKADKYLLTMKTHIIQSLSYFPKLGRSAEEYGQNIRKLVHQKYSILYIIKPDEINIISIYRENLPNI